MDKVDHSKLTTVQNTITNILNTVNNPDSSVKDLKYIIEVDPLLTANVIRLSNSAYYGYPKRVSEVQEAIICIGFDAVKELALSIKVSELFAGKEHFSGYSRVSLWKHSVAVALCSKMICRREFKRRGGNMYAAGLLHDLGLIILEQFEIRMFKEVFARNRRENKGLVDLESETFGFSHMDVGKKVAELWGFPDEFVYAIGNHHEPLNAPEEFSLVSNIIFIADQICQSQMIGYTEKGELDKKTYFSALSRIGINEKSVELIMKEVKTDFKKMEDEGLI
ncbi:HDOD domain-containing protein [candidate division KSB1 bacterium]